jgi:hypothetical protein
MAYERIESYKEFFIFVPPEDEVEKRHGVLNACLSMGLLRWGVAAT